MQVQYLSDTIDKLVSLNVSDYSPYNHAHSIRARLYLLGAVMSIYLVSRHLGAVEWMNHMGHHYDKHLTHLDNYDQLSAGDIVIGSLPINLAADLADRGVGYVHLSLSVPEHLRGRELSAEQLSHLDAKLEAFGVRRIIASADITVCSALNQEIATRQHVGLLCF